MKRVAVAAGVIAVVVAVTAFVLVHRVHAAEAAWAASIGPIEKVPAKYRTAGNASAAMLGEWSARVTPTGRAQTVVFDYLLHEVESPAAHAQPNPFVRHFQSADVDEFAAWVSANPPVLEYAFRSPDDAIPNLFPMLRLQKTLLAAAIARSAAGDRDGAERLLEASWRMNEPLLHSPTLIGQLVGTAAFRYQLGALRKAETDPAKWLPRIRSVDLVTSIGRTTDLQAWYSDFSVRSNLYASERHLRQERQLASAAGEPAPFKPQWLQILRTPVRWFDLPSVLEGNRQMALAVAKASRSEHIDRELRAAWARGAGTWWYVPDPDVKWEDWSGAYRRAVRTLAEQELTENALLARTGHPIETSSAIENAKWIDDGKTIRISREIDWGNLLGTHVPLRYSLH